MIAIKDLYLSSKFLNKRGMNQYLTKIKQQVNDIKASPAFSQEFQKKKTGISFNDDIVFTTKYLTDEFKTSKNVQEIFENMKRNKKVDNKFLDGLKIKNNYKPLDSVLYNISILKYNMSHGYFSKALMNIKDSLEILNENEISTYDPLSITLRLEQSYIEAHNSDNYQALTGKILKEIVNGYIVNDPAIIVSGYLYLMKFQFFFNFYFDIPVLLHLTYDVSNKNKINNTYVMDNLIKTYIINQFKKSKTNNFISKHSSTSKMSVLADLRKNIEIYTQDPKKYHQLLDKLQKTLKYYSDNHPNDPDLWQFHVKKWVIESSLGREATAEYNLDSAKKLIGEQFALAETNVINEFGRDSLYECLNYQNYYSASDFFKKNVKITSKNNYLNLVYKSINLQILASMKANEKEVVDKLDDFCKSNDKFFLGESDYFKKSIIDSLNYMGYRGVVEALTEKNKEAERA